MADFLFEIGLEEVPARMIAGAQAELQQRVVKMLERERLNELRKEQALQTGPGQKNEVIASVIMLELDVARDKAGIDEVIAGLLARPLRQEAV